MTREEFEFLKELQHELRTQEHDCQAAPRFWGILEEGQHIVPEGYGDVVEVLDKSCGDPHVFTPEQFVEYVKEQLSQMEDDEDRDDEWSSVDEDSINEVVEFANEYLGCDAEVFESKKFTKVSDQTGCFLTKRAALEAPDGLYDTTGGDEVVRRRESAYQAVVDSYTNTFNRKYKNLPTIKGDELHRFKNFLNTVQQTFGLKFPAFKKQGELFCNLAKLWAVWGAENLDSISKGDSEVSSKRKFTRSEKKHRNPERIYPEGTKVVKFSGKPFKSGEHVNTVKDVIEHPNKIDPETGKGVPAYTFYEDDSIVECASCTWAESIPVQL